MENYSTIEGMVRQSLDIPLKKGKKERMHSVLLAVDPGKTGGLAYRDPYGEIVLKKWTTEADFLDFINERECPEFAVVEDVPVFVSGATSNASSFKLGYNYGFICGAIRACDIPLELAKPREWQKGLHGVKPRIGYTDRKRILKNNAKRLYPKLDGLTNATADALLILHYYLEKNPHLK